MKIVWIFSIQFFGSSGTGLSSGLWNDPVYGRDISAFSEKNEGEKNLLGF